MAGKRSSLLESVKIWSGRGDLNARPPAPKAGALPGCATPRLPRFYRAPAPAAPLLSAASPIIARFLPPSPAADPHIDTRARSPPADGTPPIAPAPEKSHRAEVAARSRARTGSPP